MAKAGRNIIPTIDLSPFFNGSGGDDEDLRKKKAKEIIDHACSAYGFFQIVNHGVPLDLMTRALELSEKFFDIPNEEKVKLKSSLESSEGLPIPAGYTCVPEHGVDKKYEYLITFRPGSSCNLYPDGLPEFREAIEEIFTYLTKTGLLIESILNECLDLPPNFLKEYNNGRSWDLLTALRYFPTTDPKDNTGLVEHQDANLITFLFHAVGGLEVLKDEEWIPVTATNGSIIVNIGDAMQVLSNKKYRSATHRVMKQAEKHRHSYAFFYTLEGDKWVEPLDKFSKENGEPPKYRGFFFKDYQKLRRRNKTNPPSRPEDVICINHFAISNQD